MKLMKSLIKSIATSEIGIKLRNSLNIRPVMFKTLKSKKPLTASDSFLWRTDNGFKTKFKYSDILNIFYKIKNSWVEIHFYSKNNELIKIEKFSELNLSNELEITSEYLKVKDYGSFYIYHFTNEKIEEGNIISNKCYLGYSQKENLYSFVHGNTLAKFTEVSPNKLLSSDVVTTSLKKNQKYTIQKYFENFEKNELFFINPTSKKINFSLENKDFSLGPGCTNIVKVKGPIITIESNCLFLRPTVFSYNEEYLDVHHS